MSLTLMRAPMKTLHNVNIKFTITLPIGAVIGVSVGYYAASKTIKQAVDLPDAAHEYASTLAYNNLMVAAYWRAGMTAELADYLDNKMLPASMLYMDANRRPNLSSEYYAWRLRKYYEDNGISVPVMAKDILSRAPIERPAYAGQVAESKGQAEGVAPILVNPPPLKCPCRVNTTDPRRLGGTSPASLPPSLLAVARNSPSRYENTASACGFIRIILFRLCDQAGASQIHYQWSGSGGGGI